MKSIKYDICLASCDWNSNCYVESIMLQTCPIHYRSGIRVCMAHEKKGGIIVIILLSNRDKFKIA